MPALSRPIRPSARRLSWTATTLPLASLAGCHCRSCTTTPSWRWRAFWATANASAPAALPSCNRIICSATALAGKAKGNDKGKVEGLVGYARRNFLVPVPVVPSIAALNAHLEQRCLDRLDHRVRGHAESIGERLVRDLAALRERPSVPFEACERK